MIKLLIGFVLVALVAACAAVALLKSGKLTIKKNFVKQNKKAAKPPNTGSPEGSQPFGRG